VRRLVSVLAALALAAAACTSGDDPDGPEPTIPAIPTLSDNLDRWLTTERQERLADLVLTTAKQRGWAAGCVFRYNWDDKVLNEFPSPAGKAAYSVVSDPKLAPALIMFVEGSTKAGGSYGEFLYGSAFCYVPEDAGRD
jgi:hypothetical protein